MLGKCVCYEFVHLVVRFATVGAVPGFNMYLPCYDAHDALSIAETPFGPGNHGCSAGSREGLVVFESRSIYTAVEFISLLLNSYFFIYLL